MMQERWLITGAAGQLGGHVLARLHAHRPADHVIALTRRPSELPCETIRADLAGPEELLIRAVESARPTRLLHLAALTAVSDAFAAPELAQRVNSDATRTLARAAAAQGAYLLYCSTDMVFDGETAPYSEADPPRPLSVYGRSKLGGEQALAGAERVLIVRLPLLYGFPKTPRRTTFVGQIEALRPSAPGPAAPLRLFDDEYRTPISLGDAARALLELALAGATGLLHVGGPEKLSRYELVERAAAALGLGSERLERVSRTSLASAEPRPADLSLDSRLFLSRFPDLAPRTLSRATLLEGGGLPERAS